MKRKRRNFLKSSQQIMASSIKNRSKTMAATNFYLPDECWESVLKFLNDDNNNRRYLKSLSIVSKQFLSISNRLRFSLTFCESTLPFLPRLLQRFTNLTSLNFKCSSGSNINKLNKHFRQISQLLLKISSLYLSDQSTIPANGLQDFSQNIRTLTSLICYNIMFIGIPHLLIADCFPDLQVLDLNSLYGITEEGICHILRRCCNIRHLNLACCLRANLCGINFQVPKLEVLNLSGTMVDDETLHMISKSCRGLLQLLLKFFYHVTDKGVKHVVENCTQLTEINLRHCFQVHANVIVSMVFSRPSLKKITVPVLYHISQQEQELLSRQGCLVC